MVRNCHFIFLLLELILADHLPDIPPKYRHLVVKNGDMRYLLLELILADQLADHLVVKNGNFTFLLLELILADNLPDIPPLDVSSGQEWQFHISIVRAHIGRSTGRSSSGQY